MKEVEMAKTNTADLEGSLEVRSGVSWHFRGAGDKMIKTHSD
jgi:hypothetical protein